MPTYDYLNTLNDEQVSLFQTMAEREQFLIDNPYMQQLLVHTVAQIDPIMLGRLNKEGKNFQSAVIDRIKNTVPGNNLKQSRFSQNLGEV